MDRNQKKEELTREEELAAQLGVSRDALREVRSKVLTEGPDWVKQGREVVLRPAGVVKVHAALGHRSVAEAPDPKAPEGPAAPLQASAVEVLRVHSIPRNKRLLLAVNGAGAVLRVRVKDSGKFTRGMEVSAVRCRGDLYEHVGRLPRYRGRY